MDPETQDRLFKTCVENVTQPMGGLGAKGMLKIAENYGLVEKNGNIKYDRESLRDLLCRKFYPDVEMGQPTSNITVEQQKKFRSYVLPYILDDGEAWILMPVNVEREGVYTVNLLGGRCKSSETGEICGARELCEETIRNLRVSPSQLILLKSINEDDFTHHYYGLYISDSKTLHHTISNAMQESSAFHCKENSFIYFFKLADIGRFTKIPMREKNITHEHRRLAYVRHNMLGKNYDDLLEFERLYGSASELELRRWDAIDSFINKYPIKKLRETLITNSTSRESFISNTDSPVIDCSCEAKKPKIFPIVENNASEFD